MINLINVQENKYIYSLYPSDEAKFFLNFNWYWNHLSHQRAELNERYVEYKGMIVGYVVYGQHYSDRLLENKVKGISEIYHLVIDSEYQGFKIGHQVMARLIELLLDSEKFNKVYVAFAPENIAAKNFYEKLGFLNTNLNNYDDDPLYSISKKIPFVEVVDKEINIVDQSIRSSWEAQSRESFKEFNWDKWREGLVE